MCGRFSLNQSSSDLVKAFAIDSNHADAWQPSYSVAPTDKVPIIRTWRHEDQDTRELELASWGYRPSWAKPDSRAPINARLETVATNGLFRSGFASQRCLVPLSPGYYEWQTVDDGKQPFLIHNSGGVLSAAGIYAATKTNDAWTLNFTIITREARDASGEIHDRMPVFLDDTVQDEWLDPAKLVDVDGILLQLEHSSAAIAKQLHTHPVARAINNVRTAPGQDPALIEPITLT